MMVGPREGDRIAQYQVLGLIAKGGMSQVFRAQDDRLDRLVALKFLSADLSDDPSFRERFEREARAAAATGHPNVLPVFDAGDWQGLLYIAMQLVDGPDLAQVVDSNGPLHPHRVAGIVGQVGGALDAAHQRGIIHRDVKPGNILLAPRDTSGKEHAYLADFGLTTRSSGTARMTRTGVFLGTVAYVAPEQLLGQPVDARTDQYSLACVAFEALAGQTPFASGTDLSTITAHLHEPPPNLSAVLSGTPRAVDAVLARGMAKSPQDRYPSAGLFAQAMSDALAGRVGQDQQATVTLTRPAAIASQTATRQVDVTHTDEVRDVRIRRRTIVTAGTIVASVVLLAVVGWRFIDTRTPGAGGARGQQGASPEQAATPNATPGQDRGGDLAVTTPGPSAASSPRAGLTIGDEPHNGVPGAGAIQVGVVDVSGPSAGIWFGIYAAREDVTGHQVAGDRYAQGETNNTGAWTQELPPGEYVVVGDLPGYAWGDLVGANGQTGVVVSAGRRSHLAIAMGAVEVQVGDMDGARTDQEVALYMQASDVIDKPVPGQRIDRRSTDVTGTVSFRVTPGTYVVASDLPGYNWGDLQSTEGVAGVVVQPGETTMVRVVLGRLRIAAQPGTEVAAYYQRPSSAGINVPGDRIDRGGADGSGYWSIDLTGGDYAVTIGERILTDIRVRSGQLTDVGESGSTVSP